MATAQDATNDGWVSDAWDFVDNGLSRANDVLKTYVNWDVYQTNKESAQAQQDFLDDFRMNGTGLPYSTRGNGVPGSTNYGGTRPAGVSMAGFGSPAMLAVAALGIYLLASR